MNIELRQPGLERAERVKPAVIDCDIHPKPTLAALRPYLTNRWWEYLQTYGLRSRHGFAKGYPYPKATPQAARRDAWPPGGGLPGSDLAFMQAQYLDPYGIELGVMSSREPRLKASIVVPYEDGEAARAEINRRAGTRDFVQVLLLSRTADALGR